MKTIRNKCALTFVEVIIAIAILMFISHMFYLTITSKRKTPKQLQEMQTVALQKHGADLNSVREFKEWRERDGRWIVIFKRSDELESGTEHVAIFDDDGVMWLDGVIQKR